MNLASQFYTLIPHDFGRALPPVINSFDMLRAKMRQLEALMDVQVATSLLGDSSFNVGMNPIDANYKKLGATYVVVVVVFFFGFFFVFFLARP
jgi:poly [ADP-ribose] polymerase